MKKYVIEFSDAFAEQPPEFFEAVEAQVDAFLADRARKRLTLAPGIRLREIDVSPTWDTGTVVKAAEAES